MTKIPLHEMRCYFCMERPPTELFTDHLEGGGTQKFWLCDRCREEKIAADKRRENVLDFQTNDPSDLCLKCGLCCFMLHAKVSRQEVDKMVEVHGIKESTFAVPPPFIIDPNANEMQIKMPCRFLLGRPLIWTACKIHEQYRPEVCGSYLCKMAIKYRLGTISLHEARYWLRVAIQTKDFSIFNWVRDGDEVKVLMSSAIGNRIEALRKEGLDEDQIKVAVAQLVTPHYSIQSEADQFTLNMHFATHDRGDNDLRIFMTDEQIDDLKVMRPEDAATYTVFKVMSNLRALFTRVRRDGIERIVGIDEDQVERLREEVADGSSQEDSEGDGEAGAPNGDGDGPVRASSDDRRGDDERPQAGQRWLAESCGGCGNFIQGIPSVLCEPEHGGVPEHYDRCPNWEPRGLDSDHARGDREAGDDRPQPSVEHEGDRPSGSVLLREQRPSVEADGGAGDEAGEGGDGERRPPGVPDQRGEGSRDAGDVPDTGLWPERLDDIDSSQFRNEVLGLHYGEYTPKYPIKQLGVDLRDGDDEEPGGAAPGSADRTGETPSGDAE